MQAGWISVRVCVCVEGSCREGDCTFRVSELKKQTKDSHKQRLLNISEEPTSVLITEAGTLWPKILATHYVALQLAQRTHFCTYYGGRDIVAKDKLAPIVWPCS